MLVADYISHATPVGSRTLSKQLQSRLSPATIRNILADLEDLGFLTQPHTSAGRIPTAKGLRFYVDTLLEQRALTDEEQSAIREKYALNGKGVQTVIERTSNVLASVSNYIGLVVTPRWEEVELKQIEFILLSQSKLLGIFVSRDGRVENRVIDIAEGFNLCDLEKINNYCNSVFAGLTLTQAQERLEKELKETQNRYDQLISKALFLSGQILQQMGAVDVLMEGESQLLATPEFSQAESIRELLELLQERQQWLHVLKAAAAGPGVKIFIGSDLPCHGMVDLSMITASYRREGRVLGTLGIIGPARMNYSRVVPIVDFTAKLVGDLL